MCAGRVEVACDGWVMTTGLVGLGGLARGAREPVAVPRPGARWKTRVLVPAVILLASAGLLAYAARDALWPGVDVRVIPVVVKAGGSAPAAATRPASGSSGAVVAQAPGWVEPDPFAISVSALTDGVVEEVLVLEGESVTRGQVVARLVAEDARLALAKAEAELLSRRAEHKAAKDTWDHPVERDKAVKLSQAMCEEASAELDRLPLELEAEKSRLKEYEVEYQTNSALPEAAIGRLEVAKSKYRMETQAGVVKALEAKKLVLEAKSHQAEADLVAARENRRLRIEETRALAAADATVKLAEAAVAEAKLRLERTAVRSAADGVVMQRLVEPGSKVMFVGDMIHSAHIVRLYDPKRLQVRVDVPLVDAAKVGVGQAARVSVDVLPDRVFEGVVTRAVHEADVQKNTQQFKVAIKDPAQQIKPEMLAKVKFLASSSGQQTPTAKESSSAGGGMVFAPEGLIRKEGEEHWALAYDGRERRAVRRAVVPGDVRQEAWIEIREGLAPGDRLIVSERAVSDGQRVRVTGEASEEHLRTAHAGKGGHHGAH